MIPIRALFLLAALATATGGCALGGGGRPADADPGPRAPQLDSRTLALWRFDETVGPRVFDAGSYRLEGLAGIDSRTEFGRFQRARAFRREPESFVLVPHRVEMDTPDAWTIETWVRLDAVGDYELSVLAARWTPVPNEQSWLLGVVGLNRQPPDVTEASPGTFLTTITGGFPGQLVFAFQPDVASAPRVCFSAASLPLGVWTHVAVTSDGEVIQVFLDGVLDNQCIAPGAVRASNAPLVMGAYLDERRLSAFAGDLRLDSGADASAWYSLVGALDELRISNVARTEFESSLLK